MVILPPPFVCVAVSYVYVFVSEYLVRANLRQVKEALIFETVHLVDPLPFDR